jgi:hypothetical protein
MDTASPLTNTPAGADRAADAAPALAEADMSVGEILAVFMRLDEADAPAGLSASPSALTPNGAAAASAAWWGRADGAGGSEWSVRLAPGDSRAFRSWVDHKVGKQAGGSGY